MNQVFEDDQALSRRSLIRRGAVATGGVAAILGASALPAWSQSDTTTTTEPEAATVTPQSAIAFCAAAERTGALVVTNALNTLSLNATTRLAMSTFAANHEAHASALSAITDDPAALLPNISLTAELIQQIEVASSEEAAIRIIYDMELSLASTLLNTLVLLTEKSHSSVAISILAVDAQQAEAVAGPAGVNDELSGSVTSLLEGAFPAFLTVEGAINPTAFPLIPEEG